MDKNALATLLHRYTKSSLQEAEELLLLKSKYPYSQLLQTLSARVSKDHGFDNNAHELELAAVHAADRSVLKDIITFQPSESISIQPETASVEQVKIYTIQSIDSEDVADEVLRDLEKLTVLKNNFEMLMVEYSEVKAESQQVTQEQSSDISIEPVSQTVNKKEKSKSKKERIIELARAMKMGDGVGTKTEGNSDSTEKKTQTPGNHKTDELIEQIQNMKQEITPESEKQKEQDTSFR